MGPEPNANGRAYTVGTRQTCPVYSGPETNGKPGGDRKILSVRKASGRRSLAAIAAGKWLSLVETRDAQNLWFSALCMPSNGAEKASVELADVTRR